MDAAVTRWRRAEELFHAALERAAQERESWLAQACAGDAPLQELVQSLLSAHAGLEPSFLSAAPEDEFAGLQIPGFTLLRRIGAGGMASVWEAEQEHPRRRVALKLVRAVAGATHDAQRLEFEAQTMARLSHASIAQIHSAGVLETRTGRLAWFAMELVEGARTLLEHAAEHALDRAQRLALFEHVAQAVAHGHQRGVVHCDIKPANVLVDASGAVKLIDFGIARALRGAGGAHGLGAATDLAGTLPYMSPEQASGDAAAIDTRSDVYALGVVLYELLLGARPLSLAGLALHEALAAIVAQAPRPARELDAQFPAELAAVLDKALAKRPAQRYSSVRELCDDLERFTRREPVLALAPTFGRRLALFARRRTALFAALSISVLAAAAATAVSLTFAWRAERARAAESVARIHAERIAAVHQRMFEAVRPRSALGREVSARELLDDAVFAARRELADEPSALAAVLGSVGVAQAELGQLIGAEELLRDAVSAAERAGDEDGAANRSVDLAHVLILRSRLDDAHALIERTLAHVGDAPALVDTLVAALVQRSEIEHRRDDAAAAEATLTLAESLCGATTPRQRWLLAELLERRGEFAYRRKELALAERLQRQAVQLLAAEAPPDHPRLAGARNSLANVLFDQGRTDEAHEHWSAALATFERVLDPTHPDLATVVGNLALAHERRREFERAAELNERAIELRRAALGPDHPMLAAALARYASMLVAAGHLERALSLAEEAVATRRRALAAEGREADAGLAADLFSLAAVQRGLGRLSSAAATLREAELIQRRMLEPRHPTLAQTLTLLGAVRLESGDAAGAETALREALEIRRERLSGHWLTANTQSVLGGALSALGRGDEARELLESSLTTLEAALGPDDFRTREARARLAAATARDAAAESAAQQ